MIDEHFIRRPGDNVLIAADIIDPETGLPSEEIARRLVACWNACEGVSTDDIEAISRNTGPLLANKLAEVDSLRIHSVQRDELLAALERTVEYHVPKVNPLSDAADLSARAAIAKVKGSHAWKTGPADHGATNHTPVVERLVKGLPEGMLHAINAKMHEGQCPTAGSLGECAAIFDMKDGLFQAMLYIWDKDFNDSAEVARWFHEAGAEGVTVGHTLFSDNNEDRDGKTSTGCREWTVFFRMAGGAV